MKRYLGTWEKEGTGNPKVAELIVDGNSIEFYHGDYSEPFNCAFVGSDGGHNYKVFTNGPGNVGVNRTLTHSTSYRVAFVLQQNGEFELGMNVKGIKEFSFIIPEIIDWLQLKTVDFGIDATQTLTAFEYKFPSLVLKENCPRIELRFESETLTKVLESDSRTTIVLKNQPRLFVSYEGDADIQQVVDDIEILMQFWGLMVGHVSTAEDIRLNLGDEKYRNWLYLNRDFSYNLLNIGIMEKPRTSLEKIDGKLVELFSHWFDFCIDKTFELVRRMFFDANKKRQLYAEDILVEYVKILEGYHLRISCDEEVAKKLLDEIKKSEKSIKRLIFTDDGKPLFTQVLEQSVPEWKFNSAHASKIAEWIAKGFLGRISLEQRLTDLDQQYFNVISLNAKKICELAREKQVEYDNESDYIKAFYRYIVGTRNYYAHYKRDRVNVLEPIQLNDTIRVLKALLLMIFYSAMGMDKEITRKIIIWDSELHFQTQDLRKAGETSDDILYNIEKGDEQNG